MVLEKKCHLNSVHLFYLINSNVRMIFPHPKERIIL